MQKGSEFAELLREHGLRATPARLTLMAVMNAAEAPLSVKTLQVRLTHDMDGVTVYRTLESLHKAGIVIRVDMQRAHAYYELVVGREHHHHLICNSCGTIEDVECPSPTLERKTLQSSKKFASIQSHAFELFGTCTTCA